MKLNNTTTSIERIGNVSHEAQFQIRTSQKAFQILSDLYSDKPLAIVRELGCNAADAMVMAGKGDQPFHVHLPNSIEPWITIQDFGTGISHDDIYDIYTVYFASTKTNTNNQIGCLGLGSKSPFSYSDNFTVTSIHQSVKRIYNAFIKEDGNPAIALVSTDNTNESNGLSIQIPVKNDDIFNFNEATKKAFRFFDVKPTISGGDIKWDCVTPIYQSTDWMFFDRNTANYNGNCFAIMGGVTYPVDSYQIKDTDDKGELRGYHQLMRNGLVMKFAMGELDFTPARDALKYTPETVKAITNKLQKITNELPTMINGLVSAKPTLLQAIRAVIFFKEQFHFLNYKIGDGSNKQQIKWNNVDLTEPVTFFRKLAPNLKHIYKRSYHRKKYTVSGSPTFGEKVDWFIEDCRGSEKRIRMYLTDHSDREVMLFNTTDYNSLLAAGFTADMFKSCDALPKPTMARKVRSGVVVQKAKEDITIYSIGSTSRDKWDGSVYEPHQDIPKYYIVKRSDGWSLNVKLKGLLPIVCKDRLLQYCAAFDIKQTDVCMVTEREEKKAIERGAVSLIEHFKQNVKIDIDVEEFRLAIAYASSWNMKDLLKKKAFVNLPDDNKIKRILLEASFCRKKYDKYWDIAHYIEGVNTNTDKLKLTLTKAQKIVLDELVKNHYDSDNYLVLAEALG
jgi:uncharacterized protein (DUF2147 family)